MQLIMAMTQLVLTTYLMTFTSQLTVEINHSGWGILM
jgi:hypothetical protein